MTSLEKVLVAIVIMLIASTLTTGGLALYFRCKQQPAPRFSL